MRHNRDIFPADTMAYDTAEEMVDGRNDLSKVDPSSDVCFQLSF